jgi:hypothetical protein
LGNIKYSEDSTAFSGLLIIILRDSTIITGGVTDVNGNYQIKDIPFGTYNIKLSQIGFRDKLISNVEINSYQKNMDFVFPSPCRTMSRECPSGHSDEIIPIVYGLPGKRLLKKAERGAVKLGGCVITDCDPKWHCKRHNIDF